MRVMGSDRMMISSIFYDNAGTFQWGVVTTIVSVLVLFAQVAQFFTQQKAAKLIKRNDAITTFRMKDLTKLKSYIIEYDEFIAKEIISPTGIPLENTEYINVLLNIDNEYCTKLRKSLTDYGVFLTNCQYNRITEDEKMLELVTHSSRLIDTYKSYEHYEITKMEANW